jgi:DNA-binding HxlR family transcriptional regulator
MTTRKSKPSAPFAYEGLDRVIHERARLSILTSLITHPTGLSFVELKQLCAVTDGNLARHLQVLEESKMVRVTKDSVNSRAHTTNRTQTTVRITSTGRKRYLEYLTTLEQVVRDAGSANREAKRHPFANKLLPLNA